MCRNIRRLHPLKPPATDEEVRASALQFVRKLTGTRAPSKANAQAFEEAVSEVVEVTRRLFARLEVHGPPHTRDDEAARARARGEKREAQLRARYARATE